MSDLKERLDRLVDDESFAPLDTDRALADGRRVVRRRRAVALAGGLAAVVVAAVGLGPVMQWADEAALEFGDPGDRQPAAGPVPAEVAHADLVISRSGRDWVTITGLGWPLADMEPVSTPDGRVSFPEIDRLDAESMCLPMLTQAAPEVPADAWHHSQSWVDTFPTRATLPTTAEATHEGRFYQATCTLPGDHVPGSRPDLEQVPAPTDTAAVLEQCSYVGHIDFSGWSVAAADAAAGRLVAALASADGHVATCALDAEPRGRLVQLSARTAAPTVDDSLLQDATRGALVTAGRAPARAATVELRVGAAAPVTAPVVDGLYALAAPSRSPSPVARLTAYDAEGVEVASYSTENPASGGGMLPADCFYPLETGGDGC